MNSPHWDGTRWRIQERKDGKRFSFSSSVPGNKGRKECQRKYEAWKYGEAAGEKTVQRIATEYLEDVVANIQAPTIKTNAILGFILPPFAVPGKYVK